MVVKWPGTGMRNLRQSVLLQILKDRTEANITGESKFYNAERMNDLDQVLIVQKATKDRCILKTRGTERKRLHIEGGTRNSGSWWGCPYAESGDEREAICSFLPFPFPRMVIGERVLEGFLRTSSGFPWSLILNDLSVSLKMKLCQKHLAKVYGRSKHTLARLGKESSHVHPASVILTNEDTHSRNPSMPNAVKSTPKVSPYLSAVSGLFDPPTLLRRLHFKSLPTTSGKSSGKIPEAGCPQLCKHGERDPRSIPIFFEKLSLPRPVSHPPQSWAPSRAAVRQPSTRAYSCKSENATHADMKEKDMGLLTAYCDQCSVRETAGAYERAGRRAETRADRPTKRIGLMPDEVLSRPTSRIGLMPEEIIAQSGQQKPSSKARLRLHGDGEVGSSPNWDVVDCSSETGFTTMGSRSQLSRSEAYSTSGLSSKKTPADGSHDRRLHCIGPIVGEQQKRLEYETGACSSACVGSTLEAPSSSSRQNYRAFTCISNLTPTGTREAHGNQAQDEFSSASSRFLKLSHQATQENHPAEVHASYLSRIRGFSELAVPKEDAFTGSRYERTLSVRMDGSGYEERPSDRRLESPSHLARVTKSNTKRLEKSSTSLWKYGRMALCTENPVRDYTTGSPPNFRVKPPVKRASWGKSGNRKLVSHICHVLKVHGFGPVAMETLDCLEEKLDSYIVNAVLQQTKDPSLALNFFRWAKQREGYKHDVYTYTTMMNILGRARNLSGVRHLLQEMYNDGCEPTAVTYNILILTYGKVKSLSESLRVFRIMKESGCQPDAITYSILIHLCVKSGFHQEALKLYEGMQEVGLQPDTVTYSIVIDSLGKAGKLNEARRLFREMRDKGFTPNEFTYNSLIDRHAKKGQTKYAVRYYEQMLKDGFPLNPVVCTTMMGVLASLGKYTEAEALFSEMQESKVAADTAAYSLMINMWGQAGDLDKAVSWFGRMLGNMVTPSLSTFTALVNAHLDSHLYEGAQHFLTSMAMWGISPDLKVYTSLLRHSIGCEKPEYVDAVLGLMDQLGHPAHKFVFDLLTSKCQDRKNTRKQIEKFLDLVQHEDQDSKQAFANALVAFLHKLQCKTDPGIVWEIALEKGIFPSSIVRRENPNLWLIDLHCLSVGTGLVALPRLLLILRDNWVEAPTEKVYIVTGWGKRSRVTGSSSLKNSVNKLLEEAKSPFSLDHTNAGVFVSDGVAFRDWISLPLSRRRLGLDVP
ncbi:hypothetical protein R1sor_006609 [Riccia sorocarpa]|uniref:Smr domain-containing protein n=1 Tax=Riccia sorocarpa TaxID=122646 RepID=A0ABD3HMY6_9MARC